MRSLLEGSASSCCWEKIIRGDAIKLHGKTGLSRHIHTRSPKEMPRGQKIGVGIVANPESGCDVRRLVSCASVFPTSEKVSMVIRVLAALGAFGVQGVLMMPDHSGIAAGVMRAVQAHYSAALDPWPEVFVMDQAIERSANDTRRAVRFMLDAGVRL